MFDESLGFLEQFRAFWRRHPGFEVLGGVVADDRRPETILLGGGLKIHPAVARVFRLGGLNSHRPFAIRVVHPGLNLREDHFGDVRAGRLTGPVWLRALAEAATLEQGDGLTDNFSPLAGALPGSSSCERKFRLIVHSLLS